LDRSETVRDTEGDAIGKRSGKEAFITKKIKKTLNKTVPR